MESERCSSLVTGERMPALGSPSIWGLGCMESPRISMGTHPGRAEALLWGRTVFYKLEGTLHFSALFRKMSYSSVSVLFIS